MIGGDAILYDVSKQYIRLSTSILQVCEKQEIDGVGKWQLNSYFVQPVFIPKEITMHIDGQFMNGDTRDSVVL